MHGSCLLDCKQPAPPPEPPEPLLLFFQPLTGADALEGEPDSLELALRLEAAIWQDIDAIQALAGKLRERASPLPAGLQCLRPMPRPGQPGSSGGGAAELRAGAHPDWPTLRRLQRLSFAVVCMLANVSGSEGRQAFLEAPSTSARLRLGLAALRKHRQVLAAVVAVEGL